MKLYTQNWDDKKGDVLERGEDRDDKNDFYAVIGHDLVYVLNVYAAVMA